MTYPKIIQDCFKGKINANFPAEKRSMAEASKYLQGQLILDNGKLHGSYFSRSVILVCQHNSDGAFGLVLNRSTEHSVGDALEADLPDALLQLPLFQGGPVQQREVWFLHSDQFLLNTNVMPNLNFGNSLDTLSELGESYSSTQRLKVFSGYAGWASGQLEDEMGLDTWMTHPASLDLIYHSQAELLWQNILRSKGGKYRILAESPEDPSWN